MKYTEEQIKQIFADNSDCYADAEGQNKAIPAMTLQAFLSSFKKAMELMQPPATKPLSEITDEDAIHVAHFMDWETPISRDDFREIRDQLIVKIKHRWVTWVCIDFLRSNGYILPTQK